MSASLDHVAIHALIAAEKTLEHLIHLLYLIFGSR